MKYKYKNVTIFGRPPTTRIIMVMAYYFYLYVPYYLYNPYIFIITLVVYYGTTSSLLKLKRFSGTI